MFSTRAKSINSFSSACPSFNLNSFVVPIVLLVVATHSIPLDGDSSSLFDAESTESSGDDTDMLHRASVNRNQTHHVVQFVDASGRYRKTDELVKALHSLGIDLIETGSNRYRASTLQEPSSSASRVVKNSSRTQSVTNRSNIHSLRRPTVDSSPPCYVLFDHVITDMEQLSGDRYQFTSSDVDAESTRLRTVTLQLIEFRRKSRHSRNLAMTSSVRNHEGDNRAEEGDVVDWCINAISMPATRFMTSISADLDTYGELSTKTLTSSIDEGQGQVLDNETLPTVAVGRSSSKSLKEEGLNKRQVLVISTCSTVIGTFSIVALILRVRNYMKRSKQDKQGARRHGRSNSLNAHRGHHHASLDAFTSHSDPKEKPGAKNSTWNRIARSGLAASTAGQATASSVTKRPSGITPCDPNGGRSSSSGDVNAVNYVRHLGLLKSPGSRQVESCGNKVILWCCSKLVHHRRHSGGTYVKYNCPLTRRYVRTIVAAVALIALITVLCVVRTYSFSVTGLERHHGPTKTFRIADVSSAPVTNNTLTVVAGGSNRAGRGGGGKGKNRNRNKAGDRKKKQGRPPSRRGPRRKHKQQRKDQQSAPNVVPVPPPPVVSTCPFQRVPGYDVCDFKRHLPCQRRLRASELLMEEGEMQLLDKLVPLPILRRLATIPRDSLDPVHMTLVPFLSAMQWKSGVAGTVGLVGHAGYGKLTSLLACVVDGKSGERLFVSDPFIDGEPALSAAAMRIQTAGGFDLAHRSDFRFGAGAIHAMRSGPDRHEVFVANVLDTTGFDEQSHDIERRMIVYRGGLTELRQNLVQTVGSLPLFRLIAFDLSSATDLAVGHGPSSEPDGSALTSAVEMAACILSEGGLVVLDGSLDSVIPTVEVFFNRNGRSTLVPLLYAGNKLYMTTTDFRRKYYDYVMQFGDWMEVRLGRGAMSIEKDQICGFDILIL